MQLYKQESGLSQSKTGIASFLISIGKLLQSPRFKVHHFSVKDRRMNVHSL